MHKVFVFGSMGVYRIPLEVEQQLRNIMVDTGGDVSFIVGDANGVDSAFHMALSSVGAASKTKVYCVNSPRNNKFNLETEVFDDGGLVGRELYEVKDREMINDCTFAICVWDGVSQGTFRNISILKANDKPVYIYKVNK